MSDELSSVSGEDTQPLPGEEMAVNLTDQDASEVYHAIKLGAIGLLIPSDVRSEVALTPVICELPGSPGWIRGVTTLRGIAAPVFTIDPFLEHMSQKRSGRAVALIGEGDFMVGIELDSLPQRVSLSRKDRLSNTPPLPASIKPFVKESYKNQDGLWLMWDIDGFFSAVAELAKASDINSENI
ncbi:MAG: chemotaxis protein CheW [Acidiferrobacterales bacterium]|nr:chemotaxis protein CheW [Acidiferrobacterales bacterium]